MNRLAIAACPLFLSLPAANAAIEATKPERPVIKLDFCLGGKKVEARANLADREGFLYPVLMGRNVLKTGDYMIDPQRSFIHEPGCKKK